MVEVKDVPAVLNELVRRANETTRRLRALEERSSLIENKISSIQDTLLRTNSENKDINEKLTNQLKGFQTELMRIDNELLKVNKNIERTAKRSELKELENMMSFFNPLKSNFVTKDEVERMIEARRK